MCRVTVFGLLIAAMTLAVVLACGDGDEPTPRTAPAPAPTTAPAPVPTIAPALAPTTAPATAPAPAASPKPAAAMEIPESKNPGGTIIYARPDLGSSGGVNSIGPGWLTPWGVAEDVFTWRFRDDGSIDYNYPQLAVSFDLAPDLSKVTIKTRQGVQFHGGWGEMTAEDVAWSYNMANPRITPHSITGSAGNLSALFGDNPVKALDDSTVEFTFATFDVSWINNTMNTGGNVGIGINSKKLFDDVGEDAMKSLPNIVYTGNFELDSWADGDRGVLIPFVDHWEMTPQVDKVIVQAIPEDATRAAAMMTGEVDAAFLPTSKTAELADLGFITTSNGNASQQGIYFTGNYWESVHAQTGESLDVEGSGVYANDLPWIGNPFSPEDDNNPAGMDDMEQARLVRWALAMAIDRESVNDQLLNGLGGPIYVEFIDPKSEHWQDKWYVPYDPAKAEEWLDKAGYPKGDDGVRFVMPIFVAGWEIQNLVEEIGDAVSGYFAKIGVETPVQKYPYAVYRPGLIGRTATIPILYFDDDGQSIFPHDQPKGLVNSSLTRGGYCVCFEAPEISKLYMEAAKEPSKEKRNDLMDQFFDFVHHWALQPGVVSVPELVIYNPNSIAEWQMEPTIFGESAFGNIVPKR